MCKTGKKNNFQTLFSKAFLLFYSPLLSLFWSLWRRSRFTEKDDIALQRFSFGRTSKTVKVHFARLINKVVDDSAGNHTIYSINMAGPPELV